MQEMSCTWTYGSSAGNGKGNLVMPNYPGQREQTVHYLSPGILKPGGFYPCRINK